MTFPTESNKATQKSTFSRSRSIENKPVGCKKHCESVIYGSSLCVRQEIESSVEDSTVVMEVYSRTVVSSVTNAR